jgi:hypothetical protein
MVLVDFAQPAKRENKQLSLLVLNPLTVLVNGNEMTVEQNELILHKASRFTEKTILSSLRQFCF